MSIEIIKVPDLGGADSVEVIEVCVAEGDQINAEDSLLVLETDKASMEVPSPYSGKVVSVKVKEGDELSEGAVILELEIVSNEEQAVEPEADVKPEPVNDVTPASADNNPAVATATVVEPISVPDIGGSDAVEVIEVCVAVGDSIAEGDSLVVLESDKASMEVPSPKDGKVISIHLKEGDSISEGALILELEVQSTNAVAPPVTPSPVSPPVANHSNTVAAVQSSSPITPQLPPVTSDDIYAGPAVRRLARELGADLNQVKGTGPRGRVSKDDLKTFVKQQLTSPSTGAASGSGIPVMPAIDFSQFGDINIEKMGKIHKLTSANMQRSWLNVPHVTQFDDADITDLESFRSSLKPEMERRGVKITPLAFLIKACAAALVEHPKFNASLQPDGEHIVYKKYVNIGFAVDTPAGLVVPVIRDADKKSVWELAAESLELATKAKNKKLKPADMQGGCFTISSLGNIGGQGFTPIVNAPEVAILGVSKLSMKPVWNGSDFEPRKMLPLSLSYDHRAINGADGGRFFTFLGEVLGDIRKLVL
ncbi:dihydrolipoyllysine-residue acetyltransferase [bacterium]|nr:dihydrolipoyllysine-residue acetyltransferase [bacterium]